MTSSHWLLMAATGLLTLTSVVGQNPQKGSGTIDPKTVSVTGCLIQADTPDHSFLLKDGTGKAYPLDAADQAENLKVHATHKVTITGTSLKGEGAHDEDRIKVTEVKMISANCP